MRPGWEASFPSRAAASRCPSPIPTARPLGNSNGLPGATWPGGSGALSPAPPHGPAALRPQAGPPSLTQGIPDPDAIARQKDAYLKMLDDQLKQGVTVLDQQVKYQRDYLVVQCDQQKKHFLLQLDQQLKAQEMALTQQYNEQLMALQLQAGTQKAALEQQAMQLSMEYEQRKAEEHIWAAPATLFSEHMYRQQYELHQQQSEMASKLMADLHRIAGANPVPKMPGAAGPPSALPVSRSSPGLPARGSPPRAASSGLGVYGVPPWQVPDGRGRPSLPCGGYSSYASPMAPAPAPHLAQQAAPAAAYNGAVGVLGAPMCR